MDETKDGCLFVLGIVVKEESVRFVHGVWKDRRFGVARLQFAIAASWCVVAVVV